MSILQSIREYTSIEIDDETFEALAELGLGFRLQGSGLVLGLHRSYEIFVSTGFMVSNTGP